MPHFDSDHRYWSFQQSVRKEARYFHTDHTESFLQALAKSAKSRSFTLKKDIFLWRAQLGMGESPMFDEDGNILDGAVQPGPHGTDRMKPLADQASEGRANAKGIPCLYLSNRLNSALSETRPWLGLSISVAQFKTVRDLKLVDCISKKKPELRHLFSEPPPEIRDEVMWYHIDTAFSKPINPTDSSADYAPTQIIAEMFKSEKFDGISYRSAFDGGYNVALFDINSARQVNGFLYEVKDLKFEFQECANPYFIPQEKSEGDT